MGMRCCAIRSKMFESVESYRVVISDFIQLRVRIHDNLEILERKLLILMASVPVASCLMYPKLPIHTYEFWVPLTELFLQFLSGTRS